MLRQVALTLDETFRRGGDLVARYGGEEFAVVLPGVDLAVPAFMPSACDDASGAWRFPISASIVSDRLTISAGVATLVPSLPGGLDAAPDALLRAADQALYRAKCLGRNRIAMAQQLAHPPASTSDPAPIEMAS